MARPKGDPFTVPADSIDRDGSAVPIDRRSRDWGSDRSRPNTFVFLIRDDAPDQRRNFEERAKGLKGGSNHESENAPHVSAAKFGKRTQRKRDMDPTVQRCRRAGRVSS